MSMRAGGQSRKCGMSEPWPITMVQCAERLHVSRRTLQDLIREYPFYRLAGRRKLFTEDDFHRLLEALPCPSNTSNQEHDTGTRSSMPLSPSRAGGAKSARARETRALLSRLQNKSETKCSDVKSLDLERRKRQAMP